MKLYHYVLGLVALLIAGCAAYFSVSGLSKLFGGNALQIAVMASILEAGKLVCASFAYRLWGKAPRWITALLVSFTLIMMAVTSLGIFGYLTSSYQEVSSRLDRQDTEIRSLEARRDRFEERAERFRTEREQLLSERESQQERLSQASSQFADRGWAQDQEQVENIESQVDELQSELNSTDERLSAAQDSVFSIESEITRIRTADSGVRSKLGPLLYTANAFGLERDQAIKWFIFAIIFVFDPMAVVLVITFNVVTGRHDEEQMSGYQPKAAPKNPTLPEGGTGESGGFYMPQTKNMKAFQEPGPDKEYPGFSPPSMLSSDMDYLDWDAMNEIAESLSKNNEEDEDEETIESITRQFYESNENTKEKSNKKYVLKEGGAMIRNR